MIADHIATMYRIERANGLGRDGKRHAGKWEPQLGPEYAKARLDLYTEMQGICRRLMHKSLRSHRHILDDLVQSAVLGMGKYLDTHTLDLSNPSRLQSHLVRSLLFRMRRAAVRQTAAVSMPARSATTWESMRGASSFCVPHLMPQDDLPIDLLDVVAPTPGYQDWETELNRLIEFCKKHNLDLALKDLVEIEFSEIDNTVARQTLSCRRMKQMKKVFRAFREYAL